MQNIEALYGDNLGGIGNFLFIPDTDVSSIPDSRGNVVKNNIALVTDKEWYIATLTLETIRYTEGMTRMGAGRLKEQKLTGFVPKDTPDIGNLLEEMERCRFIVVYNDNNGYKKLLGTLNSPMRFVYELDTTDKFSGRNGHQLTFYRQSSDKAPFLANGGDFNIDFSNDFFNISAD